MNALAAKMKDLKTAGEKALITFLTAGDPDLETTEMLLSVLAQNGADVLELGIPFSDPLADGPVLQAAAGRALKADTTPQKVFGMVSRFSSSHDIPVVLLVYYNTIYHCGLRDFCRQAAISGVSGLVVPDLPFEEAQELDNAAKEFGLINIRFISPTTSDVRMEKICSCARGFIYCVAVTGVTGERTALDGRLAGLIKRAKAFSGVSVAVGFGIATPEQAAGAAAFADGVIVGSALVQKLAAAGPAEKSQVAANFVKLLKNSITFS